MNKSSSCIREQKEMLVACMEEDPLLFFKELKGDAARKRYTVKWQRITVLLNSVPLGAKKSSQQWMKVWKDTKHRCRRKLMHKNSGKRFPPLTELEQRVSRLLGDQPKRKLVLKPEPDLETEKSTPTNSIQSRNKYYCIHEQKEMLIANMEVDPFLFSINHKDSDSRKRYKVKWQRLAVLLNSVPGGAKKTKLQWMKVCRGLKNRCKRKLMAVNRGIRNFDTLSEIDQRALRLLGHRSNRKLELNPDEELDSEEAETSTNDGIDLEEELFEETTPQQPVIIKAELQETVTKQSLKERQTIALEELTRTMRSIRKELASLTPVMKEIASLTPVIKEIASLAPVIKEIASLTPVMKELASFTPILKKIAASRSRDVC